MSNLVHIVKLLLSFKLSFSAVAAVNLIHVAASSPVTFTHHSGPATGYTAATGTADATIRCVAGAPESPDWSSGA